MPVFDAPAPPARVAADAGARGASSDWPTLHGDAPGRTCPAEGYRLEIAPDGGAPLQAPRTHAGRVLRRGRPCANCAGRPRSARPRSHRHGDACRAGRDRGPAPVRLARLPARRRPALPAQAEVLRFVDLLAAAQAQRAAPAPDRRPGLADRGPALSAADRGRRLAAGSMVGRAPTAAERDGRPHGGYYTTDDLREIVAYAAERLDHRRARDRRARAQPGRHRRLSRTGQHRQALPVLDALGHQRRTC